MTRSPVCLTKPSGRRRISTAGNRTRPLVTIHSVIVGQTPPRFGCGGSGDDEHRRSAHLRPLVKE
jgi:hypothetical protein